MILRLSMRVIFDVRITEAYNVTWLMM